VRLGSQCRFAEPGRYLESLPGPGLGRVDVAQLELQLAQARERVAQATLNAFDLVDPERAKEVGARRAQLAHSDQHVAEVVKRPGQREAVLQGLVDRERLLRIAGRLAELSKLLIGAAEAAVHERKTVQILD